jgi:hypothetical protein
MRKLCIKRSKYNVQKIHSLKKYKSPRQGKGLFLYKDNKRPLLKAKQQILSKTAFLIMSDKKYY